MQIRPLPNYLPLAYFDYAINDVTMFAYKCIERFLFVIVPTEESWTKVRKCFYSTHVML